MPDSSIDTVIFAPLAPILGVILFWFIQLLFIQSQKYLLSQIWHKHEPLCRFTNLLGILYQTICQALGYTVTRSGISHFIINVDYGKVSPKRERGGLSEWVANTFLFVGPFFIPASLLLIYLFFIMNGGFEITTPPQLLELRYTFGGQIATFGTSLYVFSKSFFEFLFNVDLLNPVHIGFIILMIFLGMGIRPSYIGETKKYKIDMIYDLRNIWSLITQKPLYIVALFSISYLLFYVSVLLSHNFYVALFSIFGWLSIVSIMSLVISQMILLLIKTTDEITGLWKILPYIVLIGSYILMRLIFFYIPADFTNSVSLLVMIISTLLVTYFLLGRKTNRFKSKADIKIFKKKKGETDGS